MIKLTVYKKMMLGFSTIMTIMIISSAYVLFELATVSKGAKHIITSNVWIQEQARQLQNLIQDENGYAKKYFISKDESYFSLLMETGKQVNLNLTILLDKTSSTEGNSLIHNMLQAHNTILADMQNSQFDLTADKDLLRQKKMQSLLSSLDLLVTKNHSLIRKEISRIEFINVRSIQVALLLMAGTLFVAIVAALIITQTITRPIGDLIKGTQQIAKGNFEKVYVSSNDEIVLLADAINDMSTKINNTNKLRTQTMQQISHELKNPLQAMQSAHDILKISQAVREDKLTILKIIDTGIEKIANFSQQYLNLSQIESGAMSYDMKSIDLFKIVGPVVDEAKIVADAKKINIEFNCVSSPKVMVDAEKVSMIISNLFSNAVKYTPENGSIKVNIEPCKFGVQIEIIDSGIGIDQDEINSIFTRFYQARNIKKTKTNGSGVGLAIVKAYVEGHGGRINVESCPDQGSTFKVEFPVYGDKPITAPKKNTLS